MGLIAKFGQVVSKNIQLASEIHTASAYRIPFINSAFQVAYFGLAELVWFFQPQLHQYFFELGTVMETSNYCQFGTLTIPCASWL